MSATLTDAVVALVAARPGACYPEIQRVLGKAGFDTRGECTMTIRADLVTWSGLSEALCAALADTIESGSLHLHALGADEAMLVHLCDGGLLALPVARRPPVDREYREPHWVPVVWYSGSGCRAESCLGRTAAARSMATAWASPR